MIPASELELTFSDAAATLVGTPFAHQGRDPRVGLDCVGLLYAAASLSGVTIAIEDGDERGYPKTVQHARFIRALKRRFLEAESLEPVPGSVLALWKARRGRIQHCGVVSRDGGRLIHCADEAGVVAQRLSPYWLDRIVTVFRLPLEAPR